MYAFDKATLAWFLRKEYHRFFVVYSYLFILGWILIKSVSVLIIELVMKI